MPRYLIERTYDVTEDELPEVARRSKRIAIEEFPDIVWQHSHIVTDGQGNLKSFCVYQAPTEEMVRHHARLLGQHVVENVYEIGGDVSPDDFPL
jgi:uncharacterized protein YabN with tetrapyrrole methylase and pyrophosphatase domain